MRATTSKSATGGRRTLRTSLGLLCCQYKTAILLQFTQSNTFFRHSPLDRDGADSVRAMRCEESVRRTSRGEGDFSYARADLKNTTRSPGCNYLTALAKGKTCNNCWDAGWVPRSASSRRLDTCAQAATRGQNHHAVSLSGVRTSKEQEPRKRRWYE